MKGKTLVSPSNSRLVLPVQTGNLVLLFINTMTY
jgi:hypothetical protein